MDKPRKAMPGLPLMKVIMPLLIIAAIFGIWFLKNFVMQDPILQSDNDDFALHVTEALDLEKLKSYGLPIIIDFGADSCPPCKEMAPVLEKLNKELRGKAIIKFVDVWKNQKLAHGFPVRMIPTQVFIDKDGRPFTPSDPDGMNMTMYTQKDTNEHVFTTHEGGMTEEELLAVLKKMGLTE